MPHHHATICSRSLSIAGSFFRYYLFSFSQEPGSFSCGVAKTLRSIHTGLPPIQHQRRGTRGGGMDHRKAQISESHTSGFFFPSTDSSSPRVCRQFFQHLECQKGGPNAPTFSSVERDGRKNEEQKINHYSDIVPHKVPESHVPSRARSAIPAASALANHSTAPTGHGTPPEPLRNYNRQNQCSKCPGDSF